MKAVILGADSVGSGLAIRLVSENVGVTVVDENAERLRELQQGLDISIVHGWPSHPEVLTNAVGNEADLLIAVTQNDEANLVACDYAERLNIGKKIARVHDPYFLFREDYMRWGFNADVLISPERQVSLTLRSMIEYPEANQVYDFADAKAKLACIRVLPNSQMVGQKLSQSNLPTSGIDVRVVAIYRDNELILPDGDSEIMEKDELFLVASRKNLRRAAREFAPGRQPFKRVTVVGGGKIGFSLAQHLEKYFQVKVFETSFERCNFLSSELKSSLILHANGTDQEALKRENIAGSDVFCAVSNNDETNVVSCLLAKKLGVPKTIALVNNPAYVGLIEDRMIDIDQYISPQDTTLSTLLSYIRKGDVVCAYTMRHGGAEAMEIVVHGTEQDSQVCGRTIEQLPLPYGTVVGAVIRDNQVLMAHNNVTIQSDDHLIIFTTDKTALPFVENLLKVY